MTLDELLHRWQLPAQFAHELSMTLASYPLPTGTASDTRSEAFTASECRIVCGQIDLPVWRNNVGVLEDVNGRPVRYGLANETPAMNKVIKSGDDIGIFKHVVRPQDVGRTFGIFTSIEHKKPSWKYTGTDREVAQKSWHDMVNAFGGIAVIATRGQHVIDRLVNGGLISPEVIKGQT